MNRRRFLSLTVGATALSIGLTHPGLRQALARQAVDVASLGLPELTVTQTDEGYAVSMATTPAGWTLLTFENQLSGGDSSADIMLIPEGETLDSLFTSISPDPTAPPPAWVFEVTLVGAPWAPAGGSAQALIHLSEGEWVAFSPAPGTPATFTVTAADGTVSDPGVTADVEVTMQDMAFLGLEEPLAAGPQLWKITNAGPQPHLMSFSPVPPGTTQQQLMDMLMASMTATPVGEPAGRSRRLLAAQPRCRMGSRSISCSTSRPAPTGRSASSPTRRPARPTRCWAWSRSSRWHSTAGRR